MTAAAVTDQPNREAALFIPNHGTIHALVVFVQQANDTFRHCVDTSLPTTDPYYDLSNQYDTYCAGAPPAGRYQSFTEDPATEWPAFRMVNGVPTQVRPDWADRVIDAPGTSPSAYQSGSLSHFFWEMSSGVMKLEGRVYPDLITVQESIPQGDMTELSAEILAAMRSDTHGLDFGEFDRYDNRTGLYTADADGDGQPDGDGILDMLIFMPRTGGGIAGIGRNNPGGIPPCVPGQCPDSLGVNSSGGFDYDTIDSFWRYGREQREYLDSVRVVAAYPYGSGVYSAGFDFARQVAVTAHELGHHLFGGNHPCDDDLSPTGTGDSASLMCGPRLRRMDAPDRMRLGWLTPRLVTSPAATTALSLNPSPFAGDAVRVTAGGTTGAGDVLVEGRTFGNVWDGLPALADGDVADQPFLVREGLLVHQIGPPVTTPDAAHDRYSSMDNVGTHVRLAFGPDSLHNARVAGLTPPHLGYAPGDAFTPLSRFRFAFQQGLLDDRVAITDIGVSPGAVSATLWGDFLAAPLSRTLSTNYTLSTESRARLDDWTFGGKLRFVPGPNTDVFPDSLTGASVTMLAGGSFELDGVLASFVGQPMAPVPFRFGNGARMVVTSGVLDTDHVTFGAAAAGTAWGGLRFVHNAHSTLTRTVVSGAGGSEGGPLTQTLVPGAVTVYGGAVELDRTRIEGNTTVAGVYVSGDGAEVNLLDETVVQDNSGHGVRVADSGIAWLSAGSLVTFNVAGGVFAAGKGAVAVFDAADVSGNVGPGVTARSAGSAEFTYARSVVGNNRGGLDAQDGGQILAGLCTVFAGCPHVPNSFAHNAQQGDFDARSVTGSVLYAEGNTWGNATTVADLVLVEDGASFLSVEPVLTEIGARAVYRPAESRTASGEALRVDAAPLFALAARRLAEGDTLAAGQAVLDALAGAETDDDRRSSFEAAARLFALAQPTALVDAAQAAAADSAGARPWALRALLVAQSESKRPAEADATAAMLAADYAGTEHEAVARAARVSLAVERGDEAAAVAALVVLAAGAPEAEATAEAAALVAAAFPDADVSGAFGDARAAEPAAATLADATAEGTGEVLAVGLARPNPTAGGAALAVTLPRPATVQAAVYDALGRRVATVAVADHAAGTQDVAVPPLAAGSYLVRVVVREPGAAAVVHVRRLTVVR